MFLSLVLFLVIALSSFVSISALSIPQQISLNYGNQPSEMVVMWTVDQLSAQSDCTVQYGSTADNLSFSSSATGKSYTMGTYTSPMIYKARMVGLTTGNTQYFYRVGCPSTTEFSSVYSFKSHPGVGPEIPIAFHILGDVGQTENSVNTLIELYNQYKLSTNTSLSTSSLKQQQQQQQTNSFLLNGGIINMGDLSYANGNQPLWDSFGNMKQFVSSEIPMMTTVGNHEWFDSSNNDFMAFLSRYDAPDVVLPSSSSLSSSSTSTSSSNLPHRELYYSFNSGPVHWVMLAGYCSNMKTVLSQPCLSSSSSTSSPEYQWLVSDLSSVDRSLTPWVLVSFHQPYMNSNLAHPIGLEGAPMQSAVEDVLNKYQVDLVFSGHVHAYERSCPSYKNICSPNASSPAYITIGDGGNAEGLASTWLNPQPSWSLFRQASYGHGFLNVMNQTHLSWSWIQNEDLSERTPDDVWYVKGKGWINNNNNNNNNSKNKSLRFQEQQHTNPSSFSSSSITKEPVFANNPRGQAALLRNTEAEKSSQRLKR